MLSSNRSISSTSLQDDVKEQEGSKPSSGKSPKGDDVPRPGPQSDTAGINFLRVDIGIGDRIAIINPVIMTPPEPSLAMVGGHWLPGETQTKVLTLGLPDQAGNAGVG